MHMGCSLSLSFAWIFHCYIDSVYENIKRNRSHLESLMSLGSRLPLSSSFTLTADKQETSVDEKKIRINFHFSVFSISFSFDWEDIANTQDSCLTTFLNILKFNKKILRCTSCFQFLLGVWECAQKRSFVLDILHLFWLWRQNSSRKWYISLRDVCLCLPFDWAIHQIQKVFKL